MARYAEADSYLERALDIQTRALGAEHPDDRRVPWSRPVRNDVAPMLIMSRYGGWMRLLQGGSIRAPHGAVT
jgi:Tetratricopeptide repeat